MDTSEGIRIGVVGLGWVGRELCRAGLEDPRVRLVGCVDTDPIKADRDLGEILGEGRLALRIDRDLGGMLARARPEVCVVCTSSRVESVAPLLEICALHGAHVVTSCENLGDPERIRQGIELRLHKAFQNAGLVALATGANPGFMMDRLPVTLAQGSRNIRRVRVTRVVDAATRRAQLQGKVGVGLTAEAFGEALVAGTLGHAGLTTSLRLVAKGIGVTFDKTSEASSPVMADEAMESLLGPIPKGHVRGIYQVARGYREGRELVTHELTIALGEPNPRDTIDIVGEPPLHFEGVFPGDFGTVATLLAAVPLVVAMPPGVRTVLDLPLHPREDTPLLEGAHAEESAVQQPVENKENTEPPEGSPDAQEEPSRQRPQETQSSGDAQTKKGEETIETKNGHQKTIEKKSRKRKAAKKKVVGKRPGKTETKSREPANEKAAKLSKKKAASRKPEKTSKKGSANTRTTKPAKKNTPAPKTKAAQKKAASKKPTRPGKKKTSNRKAKATRKTAVNKKPTRPAKKKTPARKTKATRKKAVNKKPTRPAKKKAPARKTKATRKKAVNKKPTGPGKKKTSNRKTGKEKLAGRNAKRPKG